MFIFTYISHNYFDDDGKAFNKYFVASNYPIFICHKLYLYTIYYFATCFRCVFHVTLHNVEL